MDDLLRDMDDMDDNIDTFGDLFIRAPSGGVGVGDMGDMGGGGVSSWDWTDSNHEHITLPMHNFSSDSESERDSGDRVILCDVCGNMEMFQDEVICHECGNGMEICGACRLGMKCVYCEKCLGKCVIKINLIGYSMVGKARLLKRVIKGQKMEKDIIGIEECDKDMNVKYMDTYSASTK